MINFSIVILTHNAPEYVEETIRTLNEVTNASDLQQCEIIVVDNASSEQTLSLLKKFKYKGYISKLYFSKTNTLFAGGNNIGASLADENSKYLLLLNSDVSIKDKDWLRILFNTKQKMHSVVASYGFCLSPMRSDGFCFMIDKDVYLQYKLDENYAWYWGITKIQSEVLSRGGKIVAYKNYDHIIVHYGGKSGKDYIGAKGMDTKFAQVVEWYKRSKGRVYLKDTKFLNFYSLVDKYRKPISL